METAILMSDHKDYIITLYFLLLFRHKSSLILGQNTTKIQCKSPQTSGTVALV